jgi:hypothetical protein
MKSAGEAMQRKQEQMRASSDIPFTGFYRLGPILVCEQGAKLRNLDLEVAAADAKYWWKTGKAPLRATPLAGGQRGQKRKKETWSPIEAVITLQEESLSESQKSAKKWWQFWKK